MSNIKDIIKQLANGGGGSSLLVGTVTAVDKDARTVDVEPINEDAPVLGVNLQANQEAKVGVVQFPRVGSFVAVAMLTGYAAGVVVLTEDIESVEVVISDSTSRLTIDEDGARLYVDKNTSAELSKDGIVLNGGSYDGVIKIVKLTEKLNGLVDTVNALIQDYVGHTHMGNMGSPTSSPVVPFTQTAAKFNKGDYEDEKVKH